MNTRSGLLYSHSMPNTLINCPLGGRKVATERDDDPPEIVKLDDPPGRAAPRERPADATSGASIRTLRGGLPGLGKRH